MSAEENFVVVDTETDPEEVAPANNDEGGAAEAPNVVAEPVIAESVIGEAVAEPVAGVLVDPLPAVPVVGVPVAQNVMDDLVNALFNVGINANPVCRSTFRNNGVRGWGWVGENRYQSRNGRVHDTTRPPPGDCFNCGGNHWRRDCPYRTGN